MSRTRAFGIIVILAREPCLNVHRHHDLHFVIGIVPLCVSEAVCRDVMQKESPAIRCWAMLGMEVGKYQPFLINALADIGV